MSKISKQRISFYANELSLKNCSESKISRFHFNTGMFQMDEREIIRSRGKCKAEGFICRSHDIFSTRETIQLLRDSYSTPCRDDGGISIAKQRGGMMKPSTLRNFYGKERREEREEKERKEKRRS